VRAVKLIFEKGSPGAGATFLRECDVERTGIPGAYARSKPPALPEIAESEVGRHFSALARGAFGVNDGFYPLGSCTMKHNPAVNEEAAGLAGFTDVHPLQPAMTAQGCLEALYVTERYLCEITGMDAMNFSPAAGAHGELTGLMMIKAYHASRGEGFRTDIIAPDSAHGTNPASAGMAGFNVINLPSAGDGRMDVRKLRELAGGKTAGMMLTNPNTLGLFERSAADAARIVREAGGLMYYDGANMNAIMGVARPGDMGFDVLHLNLHKTFASPHGGGGPGSGPVGCKAALAPFLPAGRVAKVGGEYRWESAGPMSVGRVKQFYGNFLVVVRTLAYLTALGAEGIAEVSENAVLNANYLLNALSRRFDAAYPGPCMHEFVLSLERLKRETGVTALDMAKSMIDKGMHPPTMYFPLIVREALMFEPTETETRETLDEAASALFDILDAARADPGSLKISPVGTRVSRPDEAAAARNAKVRYIFDE
jgi:glycine dehydrogenase subunit 2